MLYYLLFLSRDDELLNHEKIPEVFSKSQIKYYDNMGYSLAILLYCFRKSKNNRKLLNFWHNISGEIYGAHDTRRIRRFY